MNQQIIEANKEQKIKKIYHFIRQLNQSKNASEDAHWIETPASLVDEMISNINLNGKILVLFNVDIMLLLLKIYEIPASDIIFLSDDSVKDNLCDKVGVKYINSIEELKEMNMKFDVVIGNPPYQRGDTAAKRWTLWHKFVELSLELSDITAMITPQSITSPGPFKLIKDKVKIINIDVSKHFNVNSTFCYFVTENKTNKGNATIITDEGKFKLDVKQLDFLPFVFNQDALDKMKWLMNRDSRTWKRGEFHTSNKDKFSPCGKYEVIHTNAQTLKTNIKHDNIDKVRVCVSLSGYPTFQVIKGKGCSQATVWTEFNTLKEAREFAKECNGDFIQSIMAEFKWSGWNSKEVISHL